MNSNFAFTRLLDKEVCDYLKTYMIKLFLNSSRLKPLMAELYFNIINQKKMIK